VDWRLGRRTWEVLAPTGGSALKRQANRVAAAAGAQSPLIQFLTEATVLATKGTKRVASQSLS
jgi:hypothetical protein